MSLPFTSRLRLPHKDGRSLASLSSSFVSQKSPYVANINRNKYYNFSAHGLQRISIRAAATKASGKFEYRCKECGETTLQWSGQCMSCKGWGTLEKITAAPVAESSGGGGGGARAAARFSAGRAATFNEDSSSAPFASVPSPRRGGWVAQDVEAPQRLSEISQRTFRQRWRLMLPGESGEELGRVLGGGVVPGSLILVGGEPGVGKSTLLLQVADLLTRIADMPDVHEIDQNLISGNNNSNGNEAKESRPVLYVSGEESSEQIGSRAERMGIGSNSDVYLYSATRLDLVLGAVLRLRPRAVIIDSIQTVYLDDLPSSAGSVVQVRECASALLQVAKRERIPVFLVGHVTKSGDIAGPRVLEHIVDVVVYMEGGRQQAVRLVRCVKNRYGATDEVGVFSMEDAGLKAVQNPSALFLSARDSPISVSSAVTVVVEGTRPLLMEVQALCSPVPSGSGATPLRVPTGVKKERLWLILAVLGKHTSVRPYGVDVHINVTGGLTMNEPAADLAIAAAIASSFYERPLARDIALIGEVGLGGELRPVAQLQKRVGEAVKLGFNKIIIPHGSDLRRGGKLADAQLIECRTLKDAFEACLGPASPESRTPRRQRQQQQQTAAAEEEPFNDY